MRPCAVTTPLVSPKYREAGSGLLLSADSQGHPLNTTESSFAPYPRPEPVGPQAKTRRWPWLASVAGALVVGVSVGIIAGSPELPADESPTVQARMAQLDDREDILDTRQADVGVRQQEADAREADLEERATELDDRQDSLAQRKKDLDVRARELDDREKAVKATETELANNSIPGDGVYVVGKDVKAGVYKTTGPSGGNPVGCYYAFKNGTGADADILDNNIVKGQSSVTLKPGQVFETSSCSDWIRQ